MELTAEQLDLLRAVAESEEATAQASTIAVGRLFLELLRKRGTALPYAPSPPWHGTHPYADELQDMGLITVNYGMAKPQAWGKPADTPDQYWLRLTEAGRGVLADERDG